MASYKYDREDTSRYAEMRVHNSQLDFQEL